MAEDRSFPHGWVQCETCGAKYCSKEVYLITHRPPYEFRCDCGPNGLYLRWKKERSMVPPLPPENLSPRRSWFSRLFRGE